MSSDQWGVGNAGDSRSFATTVVGGIESRDGGVDVELIHGEHPHSRSDSSIYARFPCGRVYAFDGHRLLHEIRFRDYNYVKESHLSGDEVRKGGVCEIVINGLTCSSFFYRDIEWALLSARERLAKLHDHPIQIWDEDVRKSLIGRKVYYREFPAVVTMLIEDQGCVILEPDHPDRTHFPPCPWELEDAKDGDLVDMSENDRAKVELDSPHIWWWRK